MRSALATVRRRVICIRWRSAFRVAVILPLVSAGAAGASAHLFPAQTLRDTAISPVAVIAPVSSDLSGRLLIAVRHPPSSFHVAAATVSSPPPAVAVNSPGALHIPTMALSAYRNAERMITVSDPACGIS